MSKKRPCRFLDSACGRAALRLFRFKKFLLPSGQEFFDYCAVLWYTERMEFYTLASSSSGNAALARYGDTAVLIDAGISARRIAQALAQLGLTPAALRAVLITHAHSDHVNGLATLSRKYSVPVFASRAAAQFLACPEDTLHPFDPGDTFAVGAFAVQSFRISHDAAGSVDYRLDCASGSLGLLTDTGYVTDEAAAALSGVDTLLLEANHDVKTLQSGPYPYHLKRRILGDEGHLSNDAAAEFALRCAMAGTRDILLAHLSAENNTPVMAEYAVARRLQAAGFSIRLGVAPRDRLSDVHTVEPARYACVESEPARYARVEAEYARRVRTVK